jgi:RecA-family ATPase
VWFSELGEPKEREFLIEQIGPKGYPITAFGAGGVAKSFAMLAAGVAIASASGVEEWLGLRVLEHGHVLYLQRLAICLDW